MTTKDRIARYFGYVPEREATKAVLDALAAQDKYNKPAPKLKKDVTDIIDAITSQGYKFIGTIQDEHVFIYMYADITEMYWLQVNYDGEYCYLMKQINNQDIAALCLEITTPNHQLETAQELLESTAKRLEIARHKIEIKSESANTQIFNELTDKEKEILFSVKTGIALVKNVSVLLRELK